MDRRERWARATAVLGGLLLFLGLVAGLVHNNVVDGARFANTVNGVRHDPAVAAQVGSAVTQQLIAARPDLVALRPLVLSAVQALISSPAFDPIVTTTVRDLHASLVGGSSSGVLLRLADLGAVLTAVLPTVSAPAAQNLPPDLSVTLAQLGGSEPAEWVVRLVDLSGLGAWLLPLLALLAFAGALALSRDRWRGAARAGWSVAGAGGLLTLVTLAADVATMVAVDTDTLSGALTAATWQQLRGEVWTAALITVAVGLLIVVATTASPVPGRLLVAARRRVTSLAHSQTTRGRVARGLLIAGVGLVLIIAPRGSLLVFVVATGAVAVLWGVAEIAAAAGDRRAATGSRRAPPGPAAVHAARTGRPPAPWVAVGALALAAVLLAGLLTWQAAPVSTTVPAAADPACNGWVQLCGRRYDEVAFPAAHNAMSAADEPGWFLPEQPTGLVGSLDAGVRVLLIDSHYGQRTQNSSTVATAFRSLEPALAAAQRDFGSQTVASAVRLRDSLVAAPTGPPQPYLCHGLCELGSTEWTPVMSRVRAWLGAHPREVITFFIEDDVDPADTAQVFRDAGLLPYVHVQRPGQPWPTLGEMIDSGQRVVVLMENRGGGATLPWLLQGFDWVQDTNYTNPTLADMSCTLNRGALEHPLLLLNAWLSNFNALVTDARAVNSAAFLGPYVQRCAAERHHLPNFVAVNYWDQGDLFRVVDDLNGVR